LDQLKKDVIIIALAANELNMSGKKTKDYIDGYDSQNDGVVISLYDKLFSTNEEVEKVIKVILNESYGRVLNSIK
jgi:hypothetical protein